MTPNLTDVDEILDHCLLEVTAGRLSVEDCLNQYPQAAAQLGPLLRTAVKVHSMPRSPGLATDKRRAIEQQLLNRAAQFKPRAASPESGVPVRRVLRLRFGLLALAIVLLFMGGLGAVTASATSLPNDVLYPVKRLTEKITLATSDAAARANLHIELARRRLDEFEAMAARVEVQPALMKDATAELDAALQGAANLPEDQQRYIAEAVVRLTDVQTVLAADASITASRATRASLEASVAAAAATREQALNLVGALPPTSAATVVPTDEPALVPTAKPSETVGVVPTSTVIVPTGTREASPMEPTLEPTDKPTKTPKPAVTPPGLVKTPNTPPGQVKTPKPDAPPGQVKTPKPQK